MNPPPFLLLMTCAVWGWFTGLWIPALICAVAAEGWRFIHWRKEFSPSEQNRLWTYSILLLSVILSIVLFRSMTNTSLVRFIPLAFLPLLIMQIYGGQEYLRVSPFKVYLGKSIPPGILLVDLDVRWVFAVTSLIAAGAQNEAGSLFFTALALLTLYVFFTRLPGQGWGRLIRRALAVTVALIAGYLIQLTLYNAQPLVENAVTQWQLLNHQSFNPNQSITAIGSLRRIKLSSRLAHRVEIPEGQAAPSALIQAVYTVYHNGAWTTAKAEFSPLVSDPDFTSWTLGTPGPAPFSLRISSKVNQDPELLLQTPGTRKISLLQADTVEESTLGTLRAGGLGGVTRYSVEYDRNFSRFPKPQSTDLTVPPNESPALEQIVHSLQVEGLSARDKLKKVTDFFAHDFTYSTINKPRDSRLNNQTALADFLLNQKSGHCEYYASATTLLLRQTGIPARYVTGYAVSEQSGEANVYLLRDKHAHAWVLAYIGGRWIEVDTTPSSWVDYDVVNPGFLDHLSDAWSQVRFTILRWAQEGVFTHAAQILAVIMIVLVLVGLAKLFFRGQKMKAKRAPAMTEGPAPTGLDSPFYQIEATLAAQFAPRPSALSLSEWLNRLYTENLISPEQFALLRRILPLHYRLRFGSHEPGLRDQLEGLTSEFLSRCGAKPAVLSGRM